MKPGLHFAVFRYAMSSMFRPLALVLLATSLSGCIHVKMDVHAVVDVNVKVDKALDDFFGDLDRKSTTITPESQP